MKDINKSNSKNIFDEVNSNTKLIDIYKEVMDNESAIASIKNLSVFRLELLSHYLNSHSNEHVVSSGESLSPEEKPTTPEKPTEPEEKPVDTVINKANIKTNEYVVLYKNLDYTIEVNPTTNFNIELETDGKVLQLLDDGKTIYVAGLGNGWVKGTVSNSVSTVELNKVDVTSYHDSFKVIKPSIKLNNKDMDEFIANSDSFIPKATVLGVDLSNSNTLTYDFLIDYDGEQRVLDKRLSDNLVYIEPSSLYEVNEDNSITIPSDDGKSLSITLKYSFKDIAFSSNDNPYGEYSTEKRVNILPDVDGDNFVVKKWTKYRGVKQEDVKNILDDEDGLKFIGDGKILTKIDNKFSPLRSPKLSYSSANYSKLGKVKISFTAKGDGSVNVLLVDYFDKNLISSTFDKTVYVQSVNAYKDYSVVIDVFEKDARIFNLERAGVSIKTSKELIIKKDSLSITTDFDYGTITDGVIEPYDTDKFDYIGIPATDNPTDKSSYVWFKDGILNNRDYNDILLYSKPISDEVSIEMTGFKENNRMLYLDDSRDAYYAMISNTATQPIIYLRVNREVVDTETMIGRGKIIDNPNVTIIDEKRISFNKKGINTLEIDYDKLGDLDIPKSKVINKVVVIDNIRYIASEFLHNVSAGGEIGGISYNEIYLEYGNKYTTSLQYDELEEEETFEIVTQTFDGNGVEKIESEKTDKVILESSSKGVSINNNIITINKNELEETDIPIIITKKYVEYYKYIYFIDILGNKETLQQINNSDINTDYIYQMTSEGYNVVGFSNEDTKDINQMEIIDIDAILQAGIFKNRTEQSEEIYVEVYR